MEAITLGLLGSCVFGAVLTTASLGVACAFGKKYCAYSSKFGDDRFRRDLDAASHHPHMGNYPMLLQVNNTGLRPSDLHQLVGLTAKVLDDDGKAVFESPNLASVEGFIRSSHARNVRRSSAMPEGIAKGTFSMKIPDVEARDISVQGTWMAMDPTIADEKMQGAFNNIHRAVVKSHESEPLDVADYLLRTLENGQ